jgi:hypothetical protein
MVNFFQILILLISFSTFAQVGINTTSPAPGAILDVESSDKGVLIPRIHINDLNNIAPITGGGNSGLVGV